MPVPPLSRMKLRTAGLQSSLGASFGRVRNWNAHRHVYDRFHQGWDLEAPVGTPCRAVTDGTIHFVGHHRQYGHQLILRISRSVTHGTGLPEGVLFAHYAHLSPGILVSRGQSVRAGEVIAYTGTSGNASHSAPHLHFEIRTTSEPYPGRGPRGRIDPAVVLGYQYLQCE